ncbi:MAG: hypothetical protein KGL39_16120 [Patescibacteria group bacterium]|nr:hypothetical protein [Patescibacteria group bacterium]
MIILLYGPNSYLRQKKLREITAEFEKRNGRFSREVFDLSAPGEVAALADFCGSQSLFSEKKLAVASGAFASPDDKSVKNFLKGEIVDDDEAVVVLNETNKPPAPFAFLLKNAKLSQSFEELTEKQLEEFIKNESDARKIGLPREAVKNLKERWGKDLWGLSTEIEKIALGGAAAKAGAAGDFYGLVSSLKYGGDLKRKIISLEKLLDGRGDDTAYVFNMLGFGVKETSQLKKLADYDLSVKRGGLEYEEALLDYILSSTY